MAPQFEMLIGPKFCGLLPILVCGILGVRVFLAFAEADVTVKHSIVSAMTSVLGGCSSGG